MWKCKCDCGNEKIVRGSDLTTRKTSSCGCYRKEKTSVTHTIHGGKNSRLYAVWCDIKQRCNNSNNPIYKYYGERGIKLCEEWTNDFNVFREWAIKNGYDENAKRGKCTIDRIDVNGNYEPSNCRWVSMAEQNLNKRNTRKEDKEDD